MHGSVARPRRLDQTRQACIELAFRVWPGGGEEAEAHGIAKAAVGTAFVRPQNTFTLGTEAGDGMLGVGVLHIGVEGDGDAA